MSKASAVVAVLAALVVFPSSAGAAKVPPGFFGVVPQATPSKSDLARMAGTVETLRMPIFWFECEPKRGKYDFAKVDGEIGAAAARGIRVLPFVYGRPAWLGRQEKAPLSGEALTDWKGFLRLLVARYGPRGNFWKGGTQSEPIRRWQIWNEPNFRLFWAPHPVPRQYAQLLRLAAGAIRGADPGAQIVLGGVAPVAGGLLPWVYLRRLYRVPGVERDFDFVAVHPYSIRVGNTIAQVRLAREAIEAAGDAATPILVTELGVASSGTIPSPFVLGEAGQAEYLRGAFSALLAKRRAWRVAGVDWFTWRDGVEADIHCGFCQGAGLVDLDGRAKPAWYAYKAAVRTGVR
jgi:hypothetical protein